jgi:hypothetical protein
MAQFTLHQRMCGMLGQLPKRVLRRHRPAMIGWPLFVVTKLG